MGLKKIIIHNKNLKILCVFFTIYVLLGLCISYSAKFNDNVFFDADNYRAFLDLTEIQYHHYRVKVHPLFLIFTESVVLIINGFINNNALSVIILESFAGACSVVFLYNILEELGINKKLKRITALLYGFSFSTMIFSSIPETYIFAGLGLICYWYFVLRVSKETYPYDKNIDLLFILFGIICFGITLTNYISYMIGLIYILMMNNKNIKIFLKKFIKINIINAASIIVLCIIQKLIWAQCPIFLESILAGLLGFGYEETRYMTWNINLDKTIIWFKGIFAHSIISSNVCIENNTWVIFDEYGILAKYILIIFLILLAIACVLYIKDTFIQVDNRKKGYKLAIIITLSANLFLHYIYGAGATFLYTQHFIYLIFIILAVGVNSIKSEKIKSMLNKVLVIFLFFEIINNMYEGIVTAKLGLSSVLASVKTDFSWINTIIGTAICGFICYGICYLIERYQVNTGKNVLTIGSENEYKQMVKNIAVYFGIVLICGIFISYNYRGVQGSFDYYMAHFSKLFNKLTSLHFFWK